MKTITSSKQSGILTLRLMQFLCVLFAFAAGGSAFALPPLVAYWKFDDPVGTMMAFDSAGTNSGKLSMSGASIDGNGIAGNKLTLTSGFVSMGKALRFSNGPFSVSAWIKTTTPTECSLIVSTNMLGTDTGYMLGVNGCSSQFGKANQAFFNVNGNAQSAATPLSTSNNLNDGSWHHVVGVYDAAAGAVLVYVDGVPQSKPIPHITPNYDTNTLFVIGGETSGTQATSQFIGSIDEVQVYSGVLSQADVQDLFANQPKTVEPTSHVLPSQRSIFFYIFDHASVVLGVMALMGLTLFLLRRRVKPV